MVASIDLQILLRAHRLLCPHAFTHHSNMHSKHSCYRNIEHLALVKCVLDIPLLAHLISRRM